MQFCLNLLLLLIWQSIFFWGIFVFFFTVIIQWMCSIKSYFSGSNPQVPHLLWKQKKNLFLNTFPSYVHVFNICNNIHICMYVCIHIYALLFVFISYFCFYFWMFVYMFVERKKKKVQKV